MTATQQPVYWDGYYWRPVAVAPSNGAGTAGMVLALVGLLIPLVSVIGIVFAIVGTVNVSQGRATNQGQALAGLILSALGLAWIFVLVAYYA